MKWGKPQRDKLSRNQLIAHVCAKKATLGGPQLNVTNPFKKRSATALWRKCVSLKAPQGNLSKLRVTRNTPKPFND